MSTEPQTQTTPAPRKRWLYVALIASLGLNLLVAGGAAGAFWKHRHGHHERGLLGFVHELPADRQAAVREFLNAERAKLKHLREEIRSAWSESNEVLGTEPFDKDKMKAALDRMNDAELRMRSAVSTAIAQTAAQLTPQERQTFKAWRERAKERRHKKWRREAYVEGDAKR
ncbi:MAG TPA: periplasmic heavy metal sensor [Hyphomicrobium sp.]|nr:periplasmic heavy metal sensor [Hyphomicrobium sp.]